MTGYGAISPTVQRLRPAARAPTAVALLAIGVCVCVVVALAPQARRHAALLQRAARMNMVPLSQTQMLCEGHFLDTATGIPEVCVCVYIRVCVSVCVRVCVLRIPPRAVRVHALNSFHLPLICS